MSSEEIKNSKKEWLSDIPEVNEIQQIDLDKTYEFANEELGLQQKKRDQIITLYLAMITFFIPFTLELNNATYLIKGIMLLFLSIVGLLLGLIVIRYRIYKEIYWISLRTLSQLKNYKKEQINKTLIQSLYYISLSKIANKYVNKEKNKIKILKLAKASFFSAETLYFVLIGFVSSAILTVSLIFMLMNVPSLPRYLISIGVGVLIFILEYFRYIKALASIYVSAAKPESDSAFNKGFSKAWHLHFYKLSDKQ